MESNGKTAPFRPLYSAKVTNSTKNGDVVEFFVETLKDGDERPIVVVRVHEDFVWLLHCLKMQDDVAGVLFPPLPPPPSTSLQAAEKLTKKQSGEKARKLIGDDYGENFRAYEKFLMLCITHPRLGRSGVLQSFLLTKEAAARVKVRRGIMGTLTKAVDDIRFNNFKDNDENLQNARLHNNENIKYTKNAASTYQHHIDCEHRISSTYGDIQQALSDLSLLDKKNSKPMEELCQVMIGAVEHVSEMSHLNATKREETLGSTLKLYAGYARSQQEMLQKRVVKLLELEKAKKSYEKAKSQKKHQAEENMKKVDRELSDMTSLIKPELERHNRDRVIAVQDSLVQLVESEIKKARDGLAIFTKLYSDAQKIQL